MASRHFSLSLPSSLPPPPPSLPLPLPPLKALLGIFFQVEAVALFEDIEPALKACEDEDTCKGGISGVEYYDQDDVQHAYQSAAM